MHLNNIESFKNNVLNIGNQTKSINAIVEGRDEVIENLNDIPDFLSETELNIIHIQEQMQNNLIDNPLPIETQESPVLQPVPSGTLQLLVVTCDCSKKLDELLNKNDSSDESKKKLSEILQSNLRQEAYLEQLVTLQREIGRIKSVLALLISDSLKKQMCWAKMRGKSAYRGNFKKIDTMLLQIILHYYDEKSHGSVVWSLDDVIKGTKELSSRTKQTGVKKTVKSKKKKAVEK